MRSQITGAFRKCFKNLPIEVRKEAKKAYRLWQQDPSHPSLQFATINIGNKSLCSVRVTLGYRALGGYQESDLVVRGWIGTHSDYDKLIEARRAKKMNIAQ